MSDYERGVALVALGKVEDALQSCTKGIEKHEEEKHCLFLRGHLHRRLGKYSDGIADLLRCGKLSPTAGGVRFYLGQLYFDVEEYESAKGAFEEALKLGFDKKEECELWIRKCKAELDSSEDAATNVPLSSQANESNVNTSLPNGKVEEAGTSNDKVFKSEVSVRENGVSCSTPSTNGTGSVPKYRMQWFQTEQFMEINVFRKGIPPECVHVRISKNSISIKIELPGEEEVFEFQTILFGEVDVDSSSFKVLSTKLEVRLRKFGAFKWPTLEKSDQPHVPASGSSDPMPAKSQYPTSSLRSRKDWDSIDKYCAEELEKEKPQGEAALQDMFQKIFQQGDEDSRRAMQKSFFESNGTVLSTNWDEVGKGPVRCTPPEGIEVKKFDY